MTKDLDIVTEETLTPTLDQQANNSLSEGNTLSDIIQKLSLARDLATIMFVVRKAARKLTGADGATFVLREGNNCFYADEDAIAPLWKGKRFPMKTCISGWVMEHRQSTIIEDIYHDERVPVDAYRPTFVKSLVMVPIRTKAPLGAIGAYWADRHSPTEEEVNALKALADSTSVAMENIKLLSELEQDQQKNVAQVEITRKLMEANILLEATETELARRNTEIQALRDFGSKLQTSLYLEEAFQLIAQYCEKLLPDVCGTFYGMDATRHYLESKISWNQPIFADKIMKADDCLAIRRFSQYKVEDPHKELTCSHFNKKVNARPYSCLPLFADHEIIGLVYLEWKHHQPESIKQTQDILASMIVEQATLGISNIKLRNTLQNSEPLADL